MTAVSQPGYFNLQALTSLGTLGVGMRLYTYAQGTTTHKTAYTDAAGAVPQTYTSDGLGGQYIALDSRGELPSPLYLAAGAYDLALKTSAGATVWTRRADPSAAGIASAFMQTVLDDADAATARATLGVAASGNNTDIDGLDMVHALAPATLLPSGAVGENADRLTVTRASGYGTYGARLTTFQITDATPAGEFDVGDTSWVTQTNLTGGQVFGGWHGANTPSAALGQTYSGGAAIGQEVNAGNRWADFGLQTAPGGTRYTTGQNIIPDVLPAADGVNSTNLTTITIASPGVFTWPSTHGFTAGMAIVFGGTGTIPAGLVAGTAYYISASGLTATQFQVSTTPGGTSVNTTGSFVAPIYGVPSWPGSFAQVIGKSVHGHRWWVGSDIPPDSIMPAGWAHYESGGSVASQGPLGWAAVTGYWTYGVDFGAGIFATSPINFSFSNTHVSTATAGGQTLPANPQGFLKLTMSGSAIRVPYYNA